MIERLVASGRYRNASDVLGDGLRLVLQREAEDEARLAELREMAGAGLADYAEGRYQEFADGEALRRHLSDRAANVLGRPIE